MFDGSMILNPTLEKKGGGGGGFFLYFNSSEDFAFVCFFLLAPYVPPGSPPVSRLRAFKNTFAVMYIFFLKSFFKTPHFYSTFSKANGAHFYEIKCA